MTTLDPRQLEFRQAMSNLAAAVHVVTTDGGRNVLANLQRKSAAADRMFDSLIAHMNNALNVETRRHETDVRLPAWAS